MIWFFLALRNLLRNARRSVTTIAAVGLGYAAINVLAGFTSYMFASIEDADIYEEVNGHVQIWKKGARDYGGPDSGDYLILADDFASIKTFAAKDPRILLSAGMLEVKGSIDYEGTPGFFFGQAMVPGEKEAIFSRSTALQSADGSTYIGKVITKETPHAIAVAKGLADNLGVGIDSSVVLMASSFNGQMNAIDARIFQIVEVATRELNKRYVFLPLALAQTLYGTEGVSCVRLMLASEADTDAVAASFREQFPESDWEVIPWYEFSALYLRTKRMFDVIFGLVFAIITTIVTMSVLNTIGMAVIERTKEIGTLRAIGLKQPGVIWLFSIESALLGIMGAFSGLVITVAIALLVRVVRPTWEPPVTSREIVWEIHLVPAYLLTTFVLLVIFTSLAAIAPARRAAKQRIVDSLGHV